MNDRAKVLLEVLGIIEEYTGKKLTLFDVERRIEYELSKALTPERFE